MTERGDGGSLGPQRHNAPRRGVIDFGFWRLALAGNAAQLTGYGGLYYGPFMIGALIDESGLSEIRAGMVLSAELLALAAAALGLGRLITRRSRARIAVGAAVVAAMAHLISSVVSEFGWLLATRVGAGFAEGIVIAIGYAAAAGAARPERLFSILAIGGGLAYAAFVAAIPFVVQPHGLAGGFLVLAGLAGILCPVLRWLPAPPRAEADDAERPTAGKTPNRALGVTSLGMVCLLAIAAGIVAAFGERFALRAGYEPLEIGALLGMMALLGLTGGILAAMVDTRWGRAWPLLLGNVMRFASSMAYVWAPNATIFAVAVFAENFAYTFTMPFTLGVLSALDRQGRWTAKVPAIGMISVGVAPTIGGALMADLAMLSIVLAVVSVPAIAVFFGVARSVDRERFDMAGAGGTATLAAPEGASSAEPA